MSTSTTTSMQWEKSANSDFENWKNYDLLPEIFKKYLKKEDGFKTGEEEEKALAELTEGKRYKYGVKFDQWIYDKTGTSVFKLWRIIPKQGSGGGGGSGARKEFPPSMQVNIQEIFQDGQETREEVLDRVNYLLNQNLSRKGISDPLWSIKEVLQDKEGRPYYLLIKTQRYGSQ